MLQEPYGFKLIRKYKSERKDNLIYIKEKKNEGKVDNMKANKMYKFTTTPKIATKV